MSFEENQILHWLDELKNEKDIEELRSVGQEIFYELLKVREYADRIDIKIIELALVIHEYEDDMEDNRIEEAAKEMDCLIYEERRVQQ